MILKNRVIDILENQTTEPNWPPDNRGNKVTAIPCDETVKIGMVYNFDSGTFSEFLPVRQPTKTEQILAIVSKSKEEIENAAIDAFTEDLIEGGML